MSVTINIEPAEDAEEKDKKGITLELNLRKSLGGDFMIFDHADIDIVIMPKQNKVISFAKDLMSDAVYGAQSRLFDHLRRKGIITYDSIQAGNIYGSLEGLLQESEETDPVKIALVNISKWIDKERPYFEYLNAYEDMESDRMLQPDPEDNTTLGEVPHEEEKGSIKPGYMRDAYSMQYLYSFE